MAQLLKVFHQSWVFLQNPSISPISSQIWEAGLVLQAGSMEPETQPCCPLQVDSPPGGSRHQRNGLLSFELGPLHFATCASSCASLEYGPFPTSHRSCDGLETLVLLCPLCSCLSNWILCRIKVLQVRNKYPSIPKEYLRQQMQSSLTNRK